MDPRTVSLENLAGGVASELFDRAFREVLENINDPNTAWKPKRKITLEIEVSTDEDRSKADVKVSSKVKVAPVRPAETVVAIGKHQGRLVAVEALTQIEFPSPIGRPEAVAEGA